MSKRPVSVAISGCGAVTQAYYAPALQELTAAGRARVVAVFDPSIGTMTKVGALFPAAARQVSFERVVDTKPELVIVASPPQYHPTQAIVALEHGAAVLCEKPLAPSLDDARNMVAASEKTGGLLAVGMVRRRLPAARIIRRLLEQDVLGEVVAFEVFEGAPFRWPIHGPEYFRAGSGGVLADLGAHLIDLLGWWLGECEIVTAADDAMGGVEANAKLRVRCGGVPGEIRLSRDWQRPSHISMRGKRGSLRWDLDHTDKVQLALGEDSSIDLSPSAEDTASFEDCFAAQIEAVLDVVSGRSRADIVLAREALASVAAIDAAYRQSELLSMPWLAPRETAAARRLRAP